MKKLLTLLLFLALFQTNIFSQTAAVATDNADIRIFPSNNPQSEVHISINKAIPQNILVSSNVTGGLAVPQGHYFSQDGGVVWDGADNLPNNGVGGGDPSTAFDALGRGYLITLTKDIDGYFLQRSDDLGDNWTTQVRGAGPIKQFSFDKEMAVAFDEMDADNFANFFYCAWIDFEQCQVRFNRSEDAGVNFTNAVTIEDGFCTGTNVQTGPDGEVYVCWAFMGANCTGTTTPATQSIGFAFSNDAGQNFAATNNAFAVDNINADLRFDAASPFAGTSVQGFPSMAVDKSCGPHRGRIYIAYSSQDPNVSSRAVVMIRFSDDNGDNWSQPTNIAVEEGEQNWFPWIAVDDLTGLVNVIYFSLREAINEATNTFVAYSTDGGATWLNILVSDIGHEHGPVDPDNTRAGYAGDYIGIASYGGRSYAAWYDNRPVDQNQQTGPWNIYVSRIDYAVPILISTVNDLEINAPPHLTNQITFQAANTIQVSNTNAVQVDDGSNIKMVAGESITLVPGFSTELGATFVARIDQNMQPCSTPGMIFTKNGKSENSSQNPPTSHLDKTTSKIVCYPNPTTEYITVVCENEGISKGSELIVCDINGRVIKTAPVQSVIDNQTRFVCDVSNFAEGIYFYSINSDHGILSGRFLKTTNF